MELNGRGTNDVGTTLVVYDDELGRVKIDWDNMDKVEFLSTPSNLKLQEGPPIYGKVETFRRGLSKDSLNGIMTKNLEMKTGWG